jgi:hypothetical protein
VWGQIHGIRELYRKEEVMDDLAHIIAKGKEVQMNPTLFYEGNYICIRVDVTRDLIRFVSLSIASSRGM